MKSEWFLFKVSTNSFSAWNNSFRSSIDDDRCFSVWFVCKIRERKNWNYFLIKLICKLKLEKSLVNSPNLINILETIIHLPLYDVLWNHLNHIILGGKSHNYTQPHICWCKKILVWKNNAYSFMSCYRLTNSFRLETLHSRIVVETMPKKQNKN